MKRSLTKRQKYIILIPLFILSVWGLGKVIEQYRQVDSGIFRERNCGNFSLHVASVMKKHNMPHPINRTGSRGDLYSLCITSKLTLEQIDCSMKSVDLDTIQNCIQKEG